MYWQAIANTGIFGATKTPNKTTRANHNHWFTLGLILGHCLLNQYTFYIDQPECFYKFLTSGTKYFDPVDLASLDRNTAVRLLRLFQLSENELLDLDLDMSDVGDPFLRGNVNFSNLETYVIMMCRKMILEHYSNSKEDILFNLEELQKGFSVTIGDIRPSHMMLHYLFSQPEPLTPESIIERLKIINKNSNAYQHTDSCKTNHSLKDGSLCPVTSLVRFLKNCNSEYLGKFLSFVTGSSVLTKNSLQDITIELIELKTEAAEKLPTSSTCARTLTIYYKPHKSTTSKKSYRDFRKKISISLDQGMSFELK